MRVKFEPEWEKIFAIYLSDKVFPYRIYEEFFKFSKIDDRPKEKRKQIPLEALHKSSNPYYQ